MKNELSSKANTQPVRNKNTSSMLTGLTVTPAAPRSEGFARLAVVAGDSAVGPASALVHVADTPVQRAPPGYQQYVPGQSYPVGSMLMLPLELAVDNPANPRVFYFDGDMRSLLKSMAEHGQLTSAQAYAVEDGKFMLKSGHRRSRGLKFLRKEFIKIEVVAAPESPLVAYKQARDINVEQKSQSHFDDGIRFAEFLENKLAKDQKELSELIGIPESEISKSISSASLPRELVEKMAENIENFGLTSSYSIYRFWTKSQMDESRTLKLIERVIDGKLSNRQLDSLVKESVSNAGEKKRERALSRAEISGLGIGELKAFEGKLTLHLESLDDKVRDLVFGKILTAFEDAGLMVEKASTGGADFTG